MEDVKLPKKPTGRKPQRLPQDISTEELQRVRTECYNKSFKYGLIFDLLHQGALRRVEILSIKLNSFKWSRWFEDPEKFLRLIVLGKGKKEREVLINPETAESIAGYFIEKHQLETIEEIMDCLCKDVLLFTKANGTALIEKNVYDIVRKVSQEVLKDKFIRTHTLRHLRATELEEKGVPIRDIQKYLGHSKIATTEIYLHKSNEKAIETVEDVLTK